MFASYKITEKFSHADVAPSCADFQGAQDYLHFNFFRIFLYASRSQNTFLNSVLKSDPKNCDGFKNFRIDNGGLRC